MRKFCLALVLATVGLFTASASGNLAVEKVTVKRTWNVSDEAKEYATYDFTPGVNVTVDMPVGNSRLATAVKHWISKVLSADELDLKTAEDMVDAMVTKIKSEDGADQTVDLTITKVYENAKIVTFVVNGYDYPIGAAHGMPYTYGATFRKSDCKEMSERLVNKKAKLNLLIWNGLKKHYKVKSNSKLREYVNYSMKSLPAPTIAPWVVKEGVVFQYGSYEIGPYSSGMPAAVVPVKSLLPYLTKEGRALLK